MSVCDVLRQARERLGVQPSDDAATIKRAYRKGVLEHPPDRDPEAFQRLREAYELLCTPRSHLGALLRQPTPELSLPAPTIPTGAPPPRTSARALALALVAALDLTLPEEASRP